MATQVMKQCLFCDAILSDGEHRLCRSCATGAFPQDARLRRAGFRIHARPKDGPPLWERKGEMYTHQEAIWLEEHQRKE